MGMGNHKFSIYFYLSYPHTAAASLSLGSNLFPFPSFSSSSPGASVRGGRPGLGAACSGRQGLGARRPTGPRRGGRRTGASGGGRGLSAEADELGPAAAGRASARKPAALGARLSGRRRGGWCGLGACDMVDLGAADGASARIWASPAASLPERPRIWAAAEPATAMADLGLPRRLLAGAPANLGGSGRGFIF